MVIEDQHVPLERRPGEKDGHTTVHTVIDQPPDAANDRRWSERISTVVKEGIEIERIVDRFDEEAEKEKDDDHMVVQSPSQFLPGEQAAEKIEYASEGGYFAAEIRPELNRSRWNQFSVSTGVSGVAHGRRTSNGS
jgi:hypothetical protein